MIKRSHIFLKENQGMTLTELLIAGILVGIIMVAVVSMDLALRQTEKGSSRNGITAQRTSAMMLHIAKRVEQAAVSTSGAGDFSGIDADTSGQVLKIKLQCLNFQTSTCDPGPSDDQWVCYDVSAAGKLEYRTITSESDTCSSGTLEATLGDVVSFKPILNTSGQLYVTVTLTNRYDLTQPADPLDNPTYVLTTDMYPNTSHP